MRALRWSLAAVGLAIILPAATSEAQVRTGPEDDYYDDYDDYGPAVSEYYGTSIDRFPRWIDPDELPLIYLLAREAHVSPQLIIALRERGWSWIDITYHLGVDPYLYVARLPYSTGYWRRYSAWELRYLSDRHIIDYVNLIFWADYHRRPIRQVIIIRQQVPTWRHYARFHAPPRTVVRGVYRSTPTRPTREAVPRRAVPRDDTRGRAISRDGTGRPQDRAVPPSRPQTGSRPAQGVRRDPPSGTSGASRPTAHGGRDERAHRDERGGREERPAARGATGGSGSEAAPARRGAAPSRDAAPPRSTADRRESGVSRSGAADRRDAGSSRGTAVPANRGSTAPRSTPQAGRSGATRRGGG